MMIYAVSLIIFAIVLAGAYTYQKKRKKGDKEDTVSKKTQKYLPEIIWDDNFDCFVKEDGSCIDFVKIVSKDLSNISQDEIEVDQYRFMKLYRTYSDDLKIICMNFPCNTQKQQRYLEKKINDTKNKVQKDSLKRKLNELKWLEKNRSTREYYYMVLSKSIEDHRNNKNIIFGSLTSGRDGLVENLSKEEKIQIFFKLNNKCSLI